jgi:hypothetical protein
VAKRATPNLFELAGGGAEITWTVSGVAGESQLTYDDGQQPVTFRGPEIRQSNSPLGKLVTVVLETTADLRTVSLTLVVPRVNLGSKTEHRVRTIAVLTREKTSVAGPDPVVGQVESYRVLRLSGLGRHVFT